MRSFLPQVSVGHVGLPAYPHFPGGQAKSERGSAGYEQVKPGEGMRAEGGMNEREVGEVDGTGLRHLWFNLLGFPPLK